MHILRSTSRPTTPEEMFLLWLSSALSRYSVSICSATCRVTCGAYTLLHWELRRRESLWRASSKDLWGIRCEESAGEFDEFADSQAGEGVGAVASRVDWAVRKVSFREWMVEEDILLEEEVVFGPLMVARYELGGGGLVSEAFLFWRSEGGRSKRQLDWLCHGRYARLECDAVGKIRMEELKWGGFDSSAVVKEIGKWKMDGTE